ncbi:MAG: MarR family transcriptional regulator [Halobacteriales archaeon]
MGTPDQVAETDTETGTDGITVDRSDLADSLADLPPSAKLVYKVLEYNDTLTQGEIAEETMLPPRTVRYAITRLEEIGVVDSRFSFADARKRLYSIDIGTD